MPAAVEVFFNASESLLTAGPPCPPCGAASAKRTVPWLQCWGVATRRLCNLAAPYRTPESAPATSVGLQINWADSMWCPDAAVDRTRSFADLRSRVGKVPRCSERRAEFWRESVQVGVAKREEVLSHISLTLEDLSVRLQERGQRLAAWHRGLPGAPSSGFSTFTAARSRQAPGVVLARTQHHQIQLARTVPALQFLAMPFFLASA